MKRNDSPEGRSVRLLRVGEQVRHALSDILMRGDVHELERTSIVVRPRQRLDLRREVPAST